RASSSATRLRYASIFHERGARTGGAASAECPASRSRACIRRIFLIVFRLTLSARVMARRLIPCAVNVTTWWTNSSRERQYAVMPRSLSRPRPRSFSSARPGHPGDRRGLSRRRRRQAPTRRAAWRSDRPEAAQRSVESSPRRAQSSRRRSSPCAGCCGARVDARRASAPGPAPRPTPRRPRPPPRARPPDAPRGPPGGLRLIILVCAGWLPHDLISSWASSVLGRESRLRTACPLELVEDSLVGAFVARWLQPPIRL